ncbi:MAG: hypothetical protein HeimC2_18920 [Candidatus Heimdallarchaeota archaeon LC_2]|nr:MAG: hypothetical protein HeimC2_18920 [Candidatus Heimdallarchaeota archaeon LC_2]
MFKLVRSRRAQIRGIDFSLAIIIFSLTMGQVLLLTNTFIDGNRSHIDFQERQEFADSTAIQFVFTTGYSGFGQGTENWASIPTNALLAENWNLGLTTSGNIDPFKQSRMSNWTTSDYAINYEVAKTGMNISADYQIQILNPINVEITTISDTTPTSIDVTGTVTKASKPLFGSEIWVYVVNNLGSVAQGYAASNSNGQFSINIAGLTNNQFYTVVAISRFGLHSEDAAITPYQKGTVAIIPNYGNISLFEQIDDGYTVNVTSELDVSVDTASVVALYPGLGQNSTNSIMSPLIANQWNGSLRVPPTKTIVFVVTGLLVDGTTVRSLAYVNFPLTLDDEISNSLQPLKIKSSTSSSQLVSIMTRGLLMNIILTIWD